MDPIFDKIGTYKVAYSGRLSLYEKKSSQDTKNEGFLYPGSDFFLYRDKIASKLAILNEIQGSLGPESQFIMYRDKTVPNIPIEAAG